MTRTVGKGILLFFLVLLVVLDFGCARKGAIRNVTTVGPDRIPAVQATARAAQDDRATGEKPLREEALRAQELREQALHEQRLPERAAGERASERVDRGGADQESALLREFEIQDIHFGFNEYNLKPEGQAILRTGAKAYLQHTQYKLVIEGHCDERGTTEYNMALGQKRADEAARYLIDLGIAKERIRTISYGKEKPLDPGHDEEAFARNRRDHFVVSRP